MKTVIVIILSVILCLGFFSNQIFTGALAQQKEEGAGKNLGKIEAMRQEMLKVWGGQDFEKQKKVATDAETLFAKPIDEQGLDELSAIAKQCNKVANLIGFIEEEYSDYAREMYKYDFVVKKVRPYQSGYIRMSNKFTTYRDQAHFNLGVKSKKAGNSIAAFFYFRDAFRLTTFTDEAPPHKGLRYKAEIEMKKILGLEELETFIYWKD